MINVLKTTKYNIKNWKGNLLLQYSAFVLVGSVQWIIKGFFPGPHFYKQSTKVKGKYTCLLHGPHKQTYCK